MVDVIAPEVEVQEESVEVLGDTTPQVAPLSSEVIEQRASRYNFALGEDSPGPEVLVNDIVTGNDSVTRINAVAKEVQKREEEKQRFINDRITERPADKPVSQEEADSLVAISQATHEDLTADSILEKKFSRAVITASYFEPDNVLEEVEREDPGTADRLIDTAENTIAIQDTLRKTIEDLEARAANQGILSATSDFFERWIPFHDTLNTNNIFEGIPTDALLPGNNDEQKLIGLFSLPAEQAQIIIKNATDKLAESNLGLAIEFTRRMAAFSQSDKMLNNLFDVADATGIGAALGGTRLAKGLVNVTKATATRRPTVNAVVKAQGRNTEAALLDTVDTIHKRAGNVQVRSEFDELAKELPVTFNPRSIVDGTPNSWSVEQTQRFLADSERSSSDLLKLISDPVFIQRVSEEGLDEAMSSTVRKFNSQYNKAEDGVISVIRRKEDVTNTHLAEITLGRNNQEFFDSQAMADGYAKFHYKLPKGSFTVDNVGDNKFAIKVVKTIDETDDNVRKQLRVDLEGETPPTYTSAFMSFVRAKDDLVGEQTARNQMSTVQGASEFIGVIKDEVKRIGKLDKKSANDLEDFLDAQRFHFNPRTKEEGTFSGTLGQFESDWKAHHGRLPTEKEAQHYFAFERINNLDYMVRNFSLYRDKVRLGIENHQLRLDNKLSDVKIEGKTISALPAVEDDFARVAIIGNKTTDVQTAGIRKARSIGVDDHQIIQLTQFGEEALRKVPGLNLPEGAINYLAVKNSSASKLGLKQIPKRFGGHRQFKEQFAVKQPNLRKTEIDGQTKHHTYYGDTVFSVARTRSEAQALSKNMEKARQLLKEAQANPRQALKTFNDHVTNTLPISPREVRRMFTDVDGELSIDSPFVAVGNGEKAIDRISGEQFRQFGNIVNRNDSAHNILKTANLEFATERKGIPRSAQNIGTEDNPIFNFSRAKALDVGSTLNRSAQRIAGRRSVDDLKIKAAEDFYAMFGDLLDTSKITRGVREIEENPYKFMIDPVWKENITDRERLRAAQNYRQSMIDLLSIKSETAKNVDSYRQKLADSILKSQGQKGVDLVEDHLLHRVSDPSQFFKNVAFHTKLGLFNPVQFFLQAQSVAHVVAIEGPVRGIRAAGAAAYTTILHRAGDPGIIKAAAKHAKTWGYKTTDHFEESYNALKRSGWDRVGRDIGVRGDFLEEQVVTGKFGQALEAGTVFFNKGEQFSRNTAWHSAYQRWREANPTKAFDDVGIQEVLKRADLLTANMTAASKARWQEGVWSIPTQFFSYQARLAEQMLGKRLTGAEKRRAFATYSVLYGVPAAAALPTAVWPMAETFRKHAIDLGLDTDGTLTNLFLEGIPATMFEAVTGNQYNLAERYGPNGLSILKDFINGDKTGIELFTGVSGTSLAGFLESAEPFGALLLSPIMDNGSYNSVGWQDFNRLLSNVSSYNQAQKAVIAYNTGEHFSKNGTLLDEGIEPMQAVMMGLLGLQDQAVPDAFLKSELVRERRELVRIGKRRMLEEYSKSLRAYNRGDYDVANEHMRNTTAIRLSHGMSFQEGGEVIQGALKDQENLVESINNKWDQLSEEKQLLVLERNRNQ